MLRAATLGLCFLAAHTTGALAQSGGAAKTFEIYVGSSVGAGYDLYARLLSRHIGRHLPGQPAVVVKNMEGAGGLRLANWLYAAAPADGNVIGTFGRGIAFEGLLNPAKVNFDGRRFGWIGSMNDEVSVCVALGTSGVARFEDILAKELTVGATGAGGDTFVFSHLLNAVLGAKLKIVNGYPGGNEISLALERGEVQGRCGWSWSSLKATSSKWVESGKITVIAQYGLSRHPDLPQVPLVVDFAKNQEQSDILRLVFARQTMAWPYAVPPGTPPARVQELRRAFDAATSDPALLAEAAKSGSFEIRPVPGAKIEAILAQAYDLPEKVITTTAELLK